jgi:hypothetical protein
MGDTVNGGQVHGPSGPDVLRFWGPVSGAGSYTGNVAFASEFSPGSSSAIVSLENVEFGDISTLVMEIGGLTPGGEYDRLDISGELQPGGTLQVVLIDDFIPQTGDTFDILDWGALAAIAFETVELPGPGRVTWDTSTLYTTGRISVLTLMDDGDTDGDRDVDGEDFDTLAGTFGGSDDLRADFNLDGVVDLVDFAILRALFSTGGSAPAAPDNSATTPEPATVALLAMSGLAVLRRRKK